MRVWADRHPPKKRKGKGGAKGLAGPGVSLPPSTGRGADVGGGRSRGEAELADASSDVLAPALGDSGGVKNARGESYAPRGEGEAYTGHARRTTRCGAWVWRCLRRARS